MGNKTDIPTNHGWAKENKKDDEFASLVEPLIEWLQNNYHPHATMIISGNHAEVLEGQICFTTEKIND